MKSRWYHATVKQAGMGSIFPGDQVFVKKLAGPMVLIVAMENSNPKRETFHAKVVRKCSVLGEVAEYQQMINRKYKQLWGQL